MISFMEWVGAVGGIGAVFAVLLFFVYRQTTRLMRDDRKYMEARMTTLVDEYNRTTSDNTKVLWELITWLKARNGNK